MPRRSCQREDDPPWRVRAISYLRRICRYVATALRLRPPCRQEPDPNPDVVPEEPKLTIAAAAMASANVTTTVVAGEAARPHLVGSPSPGVSATFQGGRSVVPPDHFNNDLVLEDPDVKPIPLIVNGCEVVVFGDSMITRKQLNMCLDMTLDVIQDIHIMNIKRRYRANRRFDLDNQRLPPDYRPGVGRTLEETISNFEPRPMRIMRSSRNNSKVYIMQVGSSLATDRCYGVGEEPPQTEKPVTPKKRVVTKSGSVGKVADSSRRRGPDEVGPSRSGNYREIKDDAGNSNDADVDDEKYSTKVTKASSRKVKFCLDNVENKPDLLFNESNPAVKKKVTPLKPPRSRSFKASTLGRHEAHAVKESLSTRGIQAHVIEGKTQNPIRANSSPPQPQRAASLRSTFSIKSTRNPPPPMPSEPVNAARSIYDHLNEPGPSRSVFQPIRALPPDTTGSAPKPPPPSRSLPTTPPAAARASGITRRITLCPQCPNHILRGNWFDQDLGTSPPPPCRTTASTSAPVSISDGGPRPGHQTVSRPAGALRDRIPDQQNPQPGGATDHKWIHMDKNIMLQNGTIPFPTTYNLPD